MKWVSSVAAAAACVALASPSLALADVTRSQITAPSADPTPVFLDLTARTGSLDVRGTSDGTAGDSVDVLCYYTDEDGIEADDLHDSGPVDAGGNFAFTASGSELAALKGDNCTLRAIPSGSDPDDASAFAGPRLLVGGLQRNT